MCRNNSLEPFILSWLNILHNSDTGSRLIQLTFLGSCKCVLNVFQFFFPSVMYHVSLFPSCTVLHKPELSTERYAPGLRGFTNMFNPSFLVAGLIV